MVQIFLHAVGFRFEIVKPGWLESFKSFVFDRPSLIEQQDFDAARWRNSPEIDSETARPQPENILFTLDFLDVPWKRVPLKAFELSKDSFLSFQVEWFDGPPRLVRDFAYAPAVSGRDHASSPRRWNIGLVRSRGFPHGPSPTRRHSARPRQSPLWPYSW